MMKMLLYKSPHLLSQVHIEQVYVEREADSRELLLPMEERQQQLLSQQMLLEL